MNVIRRWLQKWRRTPEAASYEPEEDIQKENPYLPYIRSILEKVLEKRGLTYGTMRLLIIDTDSEPDSMLLQDVVEQALEQLSRDLNFLTILTRRPAYFQEYVETMYEETGLLVHVEEKNSLHSFYANTALDFEQEGCFWNLKLEEPSIYLPIYKKSWKTAENLDIYVPIGYNTVIVKGIRE